MRRTWVYLVPGASCVVFSHKAPMLTFSAFEMSCARSLPRRDEKAADRGKRVREEALTGNVVYAFHCKATGLVKIGRTTTLLKRWAKLEVGGGVALQLVCVWRGFDSRQLEKNLLDRFADVRHIGEWFREGEVLVGLRMDCTPRLPAKRT